MIRHLIIFALVGFALGAASNPKISPRLSHILANGGISEAVISFSQDTAQVLRRIDSMRFASRGAKITTMKTQLQALANENQKTVLEILSQRNIPFTSMWINNRIFVSGMSQELAQKLSELSEVVEIREKYRAYIGPVTPSNASINAEWGINKIEAEAAWNIPGGNNGAGVVVSNIDTGVRHTHEALKNNFRSSYGWFDAYSGSTTPSDSDGHGTHTMGTIAGAGGIGVAPGAQWIACKGCTSSSCEENALNKCAEFILCPTDPKGDSPDCSKAPAVVSNSWGGGQGTSWFGPAIDAWRTAGIIPVFSQGNSGPACETANSPGDNVNVIGVGSTTSADAVSPFSSRGPTASGLVKPDISAPGSAIRSSWNSGDDAYSTISGTSMACPHVSGLVALLLSSNPNLTYDQVKGLISDNAHRKLGLVTACGGTGATVFPNNHYGYGRINARASLEAAINGY